MAAILALASAVAFGASDYAGGLAARRVSPWLVAAVGQVLALVTVIVASLTFFRGQVHVGQLAWGALSGLGSGVGVVALYQGLAVATMTVVSTLSALLTAALPVAFGLILGDHLSPTNAVGVVIALPAIALVSYQRDVPHPRHARAGLIYGCLAGAGFALLLVALDRAGSHGGAWPLVPMELVALLFSAPLALRRRVASGPDRGALRLTLGAGLLAVTGNLLFLAATGHGQLATVAVLTALYPAVTVILARVLLAERWNRIQVAGLIAAAGSIVLVTLH